LGDANHLHLRLGEHDFVTLTAPSTPLTVGDAVDVDFVTPLFFDASGRRIVT
jgi:multiple sugar transport system ATP-binding protein